MSLVNQLLGNSMSGLSVNQRIANGNAALARGQNIMKPDAYSRVNSLMVHALTPEPNNASTYDFFGDALGGPISDINGYWTAGENEVPIGKIYNKLIPTLEKKDSDQGPTYSSNRPIENSASTVDYLHADLAKHYKMDANAAYGEALQNTAYRRAVADLKAAGLNPVLAVSGMNPAGTFVAGNTLARGSGSGSSGAVNSGSGKYAMSSSLYNAIGAASSIIGAVVGFKTGTGPFKWMNAATVSQLAKTLSQAAIQGYGSLKESFK